MSIEDDKQYIDPYNVYTVDGDIAEIDEKEYPCTITDAVRKHLMKELLKLQKDLSDYINILPVMGFNSAKYDINLVKQKLMKHLNLYGRDDYFVVKKNNKYICITSNNFKFIDISEYLGQGCSYDKFLKAYKCTIQKSFFPYEYFSSVDKLLETRLPPYDSFYSNLKSCNVLEEEYMTYIKNLKYNTKSEVLKKMHIIDVPKTGIENYRDLENIWKEKNMSTFKDFLIYYNNLDTGPFIQAAERLIEFYHKEKVDILKETITLPGVARKLIYKSVDKDIHFPLFSKKSKDLYYTFKKNIIGGPSIVFSRYAEAGVTKIRPYKFGKDSVFCKRIIGLDANSLYLHSLEQETSTGRMVWRRCETGFMREFDDKYLLAMRWLDYLQSKYNIKIQHAFNGGEVRVPPFAVDGWCPKGPNNVPIIFEFMGCYFHGHYCLSNLDPSFEDKRKKRYEKTMEREQYLKDQGYNVWSIWECEFRKQIKSDINLQNFLKKFERPLDKKKYLTEQEIILAVKNEVFFGAVECSLHVPDHLIEYFSELSPIFCTTDIPFDSIGEHMMSIGKNLKVSQKPRRLLVGGMRAEKILIATPLLKWYLEHGLVISKIFQTIEFDSNSKAFQNFTKRVTDCRREADVDKTQAIKGESQKLIGNSSYGSTIMDQLKHQKVYYVQGPQKASREINSKYFQKLEELDDEIYEITAQKKRIKLTLPISVGYIVLQMAKLRMLAMYYDCLDRFIDRKHFQLIQMDTDSFYIALAGESIEEVIKPELKDLFYKERNKWFPRKFPEEAALYDKRTPGLFKVEAEGDCMVALSSKMYCLYDSKMSTSKFSCKGINKRQFSNPIEKYKRVLFTGISEDGLNKGIRLNKKRLGSYTQSRSSFTAFYPKRKVLDDNINTTFLDIVLKP